MVTQPTLASNAHSNSMTDRSCSSIHNRAFGFDIPPPDAKSDYWRARRYSKLRTIRPVLAGLVADPETRLVAAELAWDVPGVFDVCNALRLYGGRRGGR